MKKQTEAPVWEQGFTFLVTNPELDTLHVQVIGQTHAKRSGECLGQFIYNLSDLLTQNDLQNVPQTFQLKGSGTKSKIKLSMALKILKRPGTKTLEPIRFASKMKSKRHSQSSLPETGKSPDNVVRVTVHPITSIVKELIVCCLFHSISAHFNNFRPSHTSDRQVTGLERRHRQLSTDATMGLGSIKLTLHYSMKNRVLSVTIHKIV